MHFSSPYTTLDDWSRHKAQTTDNMFPSSLALPGQPIQQTVTTAVTTPPAASTAPLEGGVPGAQRNSNTFLDGPFQDFMPYPPFQQFDDLTINHLHQSNKSPSQSPQIQQQQQQQQQLHQLQFQQQHHQQPVQQHPSWADQRYTQTYMPVTTTSTSMGQSVYYNQHQQQQPMPHQIQHHMQQQQQQQQQQQHYHRLQQRSLPPSQHMSYPQQHQMLPHQQQAFLGSLNPSPQQLHRPHPYPGLSPHDPLPQGLQHQLQQTGRKRKDVNDYMADGTMAVPVKKPKKKKKKAKEPEDPNAPPKPKRKTGLNKPLILSAPLSALMDDEVELSRPEIVKRLWKYIKGNDLQDPKDRRFILCDDKLKTIFHVERVNSFGMNRDLSQHLTKKEVPEEQPLSASSTETTTTTSSSSSLSTSATDETTATSTSTNIKQSPTVTAETPDDVVTPQEGEHVHLLTDGSINTTNSLAAPSNPLTSDSTASSTPLLHSLLH